MFRESEPVNGAVNRIGIDMLINAEAIIATPCLQMTISRIHTTK